MTTAVRVDFTGSELVRRRRAKTGSSRSATRDVRSAMFPVHHGPGAEGGAKHYGSQTEAVPRPDAPGRGVRIER
ncbi:hypothetical protein GCM10027515_30980 [Schumannella luteola]